MNALIALLLKDRISQFTYVDRLAGLVRAITREQSGGPVTIPVAIDVDDPLACGESTMRDMVPDEAYACMVYFEDKGMRRVQTRTRGISYESRLRLVCWVNTAKLNGDAYAADRILQQFASDLHTGMYNDGPFIGLRHTVEAVPERGKGLFSAYNYPDSVRQYLLYPFDAFALDILTTLRIKPGCEDVVTASDTACWAPPTTRRRRQPSEFSCDELNAPITGLTDAQKECIDGCGDGGECPVTTVNGTESDTPTIQVLQGGSPAGTLNPATGVHTVPECDTPCDVIAAAEASEIVTCTPDANKPDLYGALTADDAITPEVIVTALDGASKTDAVRAIICDPCPDCDDASWTLKDTAGATLDSGTIASGASADIEAPDGTVNAVDFEGDPLGSATVKSGGTAQLTIGDWSGAFPVLTENTPTYNDEGDTTTGWTNSGATLSSSSSVFRVTQDTIGVGSTTTRAVTAPVAGKDWVVYVKARASVSTIGSQILRVLGTGSELVALYFNFNIATASTANGTLSMRVTTSGGSTTNLVLKTGASLGTTWQDLAIQYDSKNQRVAVYERDANGWKFLGHLEGTNSCTTLEILLGSPTGISYFEYDYLTLVAPNIQSIGDSLTRGSTLFAPIVSLGLTNGDSTWQRWARLYPSLRNNLIVNKGVGGNTIGQVEARIQADVLDNHPALVLLGACDNDYGAGTTQSAKATNTQDCIDLCAAAGVPVVLYNGTYCASAFASQPAAKDYYKTSWADYLPALTGLSGKIDIMGALRGADGYADALLTQTDNVHPNVTGYTRMGRWIAALPYA